MACFLLKGPLGERWMSEGTPYQRLTGEAIVEGQIKWDCGGTLSSSDELMDKLESQGILWGDVIASVTHRLGIKQCAPCKARQVILNDIKELGFLETIKRLKGTF